MHLPLRATRRTCFLATTRLYSSFTAKTAVDQVVVLKDAAAVGERIREITVQAAENAIKERGYFALAIPGGSILKMLVGEDILGEWTLSNDHCLCQS